MKATRSPSRWAGGSTPRPPPATGRRSPKRWDNSTGVRRIQVDLEGVAYCDGAGAGLLIEIQRTIHGKEIELTLSGAPEPLRRMLSMFPVEKFLDVHRRPPPVSPIVVVGKATVEVLQLAAETIAFIGEVMAEAFRVARHPRLLRWADALLTVERAGVDAVPIVLLLSFLFGLILAFQSAMPLKQFGAEVYVADFLAIALMRELGPLLTSVILAGRSGSAFAAELGTMQVNEEIAALKTMGLSPVRFLALPRVLAGGFVCPLLSVFSILVGLVGGAVVLLAMGYPPRHVRGPRAAGVEIHGPHQRPREGRGLRPARVRNGLLAGIANGTRRQRGGPIHHPRRRVGTGVDHRGRRRLRRPVLCHWNLTTNPWNPQPTQPIARPSSR